MLDIKINQNLIVTATSIAAIYKIEPIDIALLSDEEKIYFELNLKRFFNSLESEGLQLVVRTRDAVIDDYKNHFKSFQVSNFKSQSLKDKYIANYLSQLKFILENNSIPIKEYYLIIKLTSKIKNNKSYVNAIKNLNSRAEKIIDNFSRCNLKIEQVVDTKGELRSLITSFIRL